MYKLLFGNIPDLDEMLSNINADNCTIINTFYATDTNQVFIIVDQPEPKNTIGFLRADKEIET